MRLLEVIITVNIVSSLGLSLVYFYLYHEYREKYMGIWCVSWLLVSGRITLDLFRFMGYNSVPLLLLNQLTSITSVVLLLVGSYAFINKKLPVSWYYGALLATIATDVCVLLEFPVGISAVPTAAYFGVVEIQLGLAFLRYIKVKRAGKYVSGYILILMGVLNFTYPLIATGDNQLATLVFFTVGSVLWIAILLGILVLYFERVRTELSVSERRFRLLAENARDIIFRINLVPNLEVEYISPAVYTITGYTPEELYRAPELIHSVLDTRHHSWLEDIQSGIFRVHPGPKILLLRSRTGEEVWGEQQLVPVYGEQGQLQALEGIIRDIRERTKVEGEMARLDQLRLLGETAAGIAHEIRNPMTTVRGFLQLFMRKTQMHAYQDHLQLMITELDRANGIITDFLSISKEQTTQLKAQSLNATILTILPFLETNGLYLSHQVKAKLGDIPLLLIDEKQIRQLVMNLVQNAFEAMESAGTVEITTSLEGDNVVLSVQDQGPGIKTEVLEKLGTPFFTTKAAGTGLGLAVCYSIAARHQAELSVHSDQCGTIFRISFPCTLDHKPKLLRIV